MNLRDPYAESGQTLQGSFSAVSKPNFASKYSLELARWKALDEIYKMYILLHRSDLKISVEEVVIILVNYLKNENSIHSNFRNFDITTAMLLLNFDEIFSEFHICVRKCQNSLFLNLFH